MQLPERVFFTGVPGSKWSAISHELEKLEGVNTSDHAPHREYEPTGMPDWAPGKYTDRPMHRGAYFGPGMEFDAKLDADYLNQAWTETGGCKIIKSHDWAYDLQAVKDAFPNDWIMLVYRPDMASYAWWFQHGGFKITYAKYDAYENHTKMLGEIATQNDRMLKFAHKHNLTWNYYNQKWILDNFGQEVKITRPWNQWDDVLVTILK